MKGRTDDDKRKVQKQSTSKRGNNAAKDILGVISGDNPLMPSCGAELAGFGFPPAGSMPTTVTMADIKASLGSHTQPHAESASDSESGDDDRGRGQAGRQAHVQKPYVSRTGSAAYAILTTLYISQKEGNAFGTKETCMEKAEASGLSDKSMYNKNTNQSMVKPGDKWYDGWSCVNKVCYGIHVKLLNPSFCVIR